MNLIKVGKEIEEAIARANFLLRGDVFKLLKAGAGREKNKMAKQALSWILKNAKIARKEKIAICQDTGLPIVFIEAGTNIKVTSSLIKTIDKAVKDGYKKNYLRASTVDPLLRTKPAYGGAAYHFDFSLKSKGLRITLFPKGFGSENKSQLKMFNPTVNFAAIEDFIVKSVKAAGCESCPPFIVGVGIGGTSDTALLSAKKALLKRVDKPNSNKSLNILEKRLLKKINALGIGPMGLGGKHTCLAVKIEKIPTHIAGLPVGVNISCHALRSATIIINPKSK